MPKSRAIQERVKRPNLILKGPVTREDLLKYIDPGSPREAEEFVRFIYQLRRKSKLRSTPE